MKKMMIVCCMLLGSVAASAQFTVYQPAETPHRSYTPSMGYGVPFTIYEPIEVAPRRSYSGQYQQQPAEPKMQQVTLRGYYQKGNDWYYTSIRVGVIGDEVRLLSVKQQNSWSNCGSVASEVGAFDSEVIRDNFTFKAYSIQYGMVYF
jgi:hypothetical protein